jgi:hypothetical protein
MQIALAATTTRRDISGFADFPTTGAGAAHGECAGRTTDIGATVSDPRSRRHAHDAADRTDPGASWDNV